MSPFLHDPVHGLNQNKPSQQQMLQSQIDLQPGAMYGDQQNRNMVPQGNPQQHNM